MILACLALVFAAPAAVVEMLDGSKIEGAVQISSDGKLVITASNAAPREISLEQIRSARLSKAATDLKPLPRGWRAEDIGKISGSSSDDKGAFVLAVDSAEIREKKWQSLHFACRVVHGEPVVVARLHEMQGPKPAVGGVLLRENMELASGYALLGISQDKHLRFETRENSWAELRVQDFGVVPLPIWVKIQRFEKETGVTAFRSSDGSNWTQVAQTKLSCHSGPYPENGDHWMPHVYSGIAITAPTNGAARLRCSDAAISVRGWQGEYFIDGAFTKMAFARPDKKIEFWWADRSPSPMLEPEKFSVRWRGSIEPKHSEPYRFYSDKGAQLRINGADAGTYRWEESRKDRVEEGKEIALVAGRKYDVEFRFAKSGREVSAARLGWSSKSQQREIISSTSVSYTFDPDAPEENSEIITNVFFPAGLWLRNGSFLAGDILASDRSSTQLAFGGNKITVLNNRVARLMLRAWRRPIRFELATSRTGMFLQSGDFMESELEELTAQRVVMSSVLFGQRGYSRDSAQPLAVAIADIAPAPASVEVALTDGSVLRARGISGDAASVSIDEMLIGKVRVPLAQVKELRRVPGADRAAK